MFYSLFEDDYIIKIFGILREEVKNKIFESEVFLVR